MAIKPYVRTATLTQQNPIVDSSGRPTPAFMTLMNGNIANLAKAVNELAELPLIKDAIAQAQAAAEAAQLAADNAQGAADSTQAQLDLLRREAALVNSYIEPASVITATYTTVSVGDHIRYYADGTSVAVTGGNVAATAVGETDYISYVDPSRAGGIVTYLASTTEPIQSGDVHVIGAVVIPTADQGTVSGGAGPAPPGRVDPEPIT